MSSTSETTAHGHHDPFVAHHFTDWEQQKESSTLGMWLFLAQEVMFFGGMFCAYVIYRVLHGAAFAEGSEHLNIWIGGLNTTILLTSSFSMAMGVYFAQTGQNRKLFWAIVCTQVFGLAFLCIKFYFEYMPKFADGVVPGASWMPVGHHYGDMAAFPDQAGLQMYFVLYFIMTSMHALHMIIGMGIMLVLMWLAHKNYFGPRRYMAVENFGLYWHFVDIVWVFLFPMFYIIH